jgi:hypothetical protein
MNPIKSKHIVIGLAAALILFLFYRVGDKDYSYNHTGVQSPLQYQPSYRSKDREQYNPTSSTQSHNPSNLTRHEILQTKVKGYREATYWGEQTSIDEKVKHFSNDEFDCFIEEVELNDADVYWGATYNE